ncbi:cobW-domain-containing protein [Artomyces pyxidatus]|uniref:CobW-domain-containing protein n=1 Tax=Artomyces pyxidatus TaxID=48021 RepID=A0ACB8SSU0_9AGAM|nr:cobW-domain-containing protein [Artomyces pyxidatus]
MPSDAPPPIPVTVFTGFLGAGKTSIILSLLPQLPKEYKVVLLKNEFGDVEVDSQLANQSSLTAVSEILNGCMCCVLVGQMKTALLEILENFHPDRIIIESSGSAFPATLAFQIRELERETHRALALDAIVTVIDAENFTGYEDTSVTARLQAQYTDMLLINKWEHVSPRALDEVLDHLYTLNELTPKIKCVNKCVDPSLIFGLDSKLFLHGKSPVDQDTSHHEEVETVTVHLAVQAQESTDRGHFHTDECGHGHLGTTFDASRQINEQDLHDALSSLSKESIYRVKGFVRFAEGWKILNWAFGRSELVPYSGPAKEGDVVRVTMMGERGEVRKLSKKFAEKLGAVVV